jgi:PAS domain S-box-containing protein
MSNLKLEQSYVIESLLNSIGLGIVVTDRSGKILLFNSAATNILGEGVDQTRPEDWPKRYGIFLNDGRTLCPEEQSPLARAIRGEKADGVELLIANPDDARREIWCIINLSPLKDASGEIEGGIVVIQDITERKEAQRVLSESEERSRLIMSGVKDYAIIMLDASGVVVRWNEGAQRIKGYRAEEIIGQHFSVFYPPDDIESGRPATELKTAVAEGRYEEEGWRVRKDGSRFFANVVLTPLVDDEGKLRGFAKITRDITERKKLMDEAARSNLALQQFASVAAHDLQEPIRTVAGFVDMLVEHQGGAVDEESARCVAKIKGGVKRMQTLINDLLTYSRIQTKPQTLMPTNCNEIVETSILTLDASICKSGATVTFDQLPTVVADAGQLSQLFENLLGNALKFAAPDRPPVVHVSAKMAGAEWLFSVEDNGIGIEKEFSERIFLLFQRLHSHAAYAGTGIGLAICKRIVERHGGQIWFESEPSKGTTFYFTIRPHGG